MLECEQLTEQIIGAAIAVHSRLGPGFVESIYEEALAMEFDNRRLRYDRQLSVPVLYDGREVGRHRLDLLVENQIVVELKAVQSFEDVHFSVVRSYLRATGKHHGLLLNFATHRLAVKRVIHG